MSKSGHQMYRLQPVEPGDGLPMGHYVILNHDTRDAHYEDLGPVQGTLEHGESHFDVVEDVGEHEVRARLRLWNNVIREINRRTLPEDRRPPPEEKGIADGLPGLVMEVADEVEVDLDDYAGEATYARNRFRNRLFDRAWEAGIRP